MVDHLGAPRPLSMRATAACDVPMRAASSAWVSLALRRASASVNASSMSGPMRSYSARNFASFIQRRRSVSNGMVMILFPARGRAPTPRRGPVRQPWDRSRSLSTRRGPAHPAHGGPAPNRAAFRSEYQNEPKTRLATIRAVCESTARRHCREGECDRLKLSPHLGRCCALLWRPEVAAFQVCSWSTSLFQRSNSCLYASAVVVSKPLQFFAQFIALGVREIGALALIDQDEQ